MRVQIRTLANESFELDGLEPSLTIAEVKQRIEQDLPQVGAADGLRLIFSGKVLRDTQSLAACNIKDGDVVVAMAHRKRKAPVKQEAPAAQPEQPQQQQQQQQQQNVPAPQPQEQQQQQPQPQAQPQQQPVQAPAAGGNLEAAGNLVVGAAYEEMVANLMGFGFPHDQVVRALRAAFNNPDRAAEYLFGGNIPDVGLGGAPAVPPQAPQNPPVGMQDDEDYAEHEHEGEGEGDDAEMELPEGMDDFYQALMQDPQLLQGAVQHLAQQDPRLAQILQDPQALAQFFNMMQQHGMGGGGGGGGMPRAPAAGVPPVARDVAPGGGDGMQAPGGGQVVRLSQEEMDAVNRLHNLGFDFQLALEAYLVCNKDEHLAANYLFEGQQ